MFPFQWRQVIQIPRLTCFDVLIGEKQHQIYGDIHSTKVPPPFISQCNIIPDLLWWCRWDEISCSSRWAVVSTLFHKKSTFLQLLSYFRAKSIGLSWCNKRLLFFLGSFETSWMRCHCASEYILAGQLLRDTLFQHFWVIMAHSKVWWSLKTLEMAL